MAGRTASKARKAEAADTPDRRLLAWYDREGRTLPWRAAPGETPDPYRVWLSEVMLQQTTVATVRPRYDRFLERWPDVASLARADLDAVLHEWQGLGYYARARNLHKCARHVADELDGHFPDTEEGLRALPGIGDYTAAAIAAIAFGHRTAPVDGNIVRVVARLRALDEPMPGARVTVRKELNGLVPQDRPGDFVQALMDLGATVCTPRNPKCLMCPWQDDCAACRAGVPEAYPVRGRKAERPTRHGVAFWLVDGKGRVLLRRRPEDGLLGGMMELPSTDWRAEPWDAAEAADAAPAYADWQVLDGTVRHTFTHFHLELRVLRGSVDDPDAVAVAEPVWCAPERFAEQALPTVMKKVVHHVAGAHAG